MPKDRNEGARAASNSNYPSPEVATSREVEISRELLRADSVAREVTAMLELLEKRLAPVLRQELDGKESSEPVPSPSTPLGQMLSDLSRVGIGNINRIQSMLSRLEL